MPIKIFTVSEMVAAEKAADAAGHSYDAMMEQAGQALADAIIERYPVEELRVLVLVGPGNNGGDGLVAGRYLAEAGADVAFYLYKDRDPDADANYRQIQELGLFAATAEFDQRYRVLRTRLAITDLVIDALLGTGVSRPIDGELAKLLKQAANGIAERRAELTSHSILTSLTARSGGAGVHGSRGESSPPPLRPSAPLPVVAVDCPSGLNCDTGALDPLALPAALTVTFAGAKRGHFIFPGAAACGELVVADIGIDPELSEVADVALVAATVADMRLLLPDRPADGHKGTFGTALIAAGSHHYWGAPVLAAQAASRTGVGLVGLAVPGAIRATAAARLPAATYPPVPAEDVLDAESAQMLLETAVGRATALLIGPGLDDAGEFLDTLLAHGDDLPPLVVDADGLNLLAQRDEWPALLPANSVLTPHPGEMARLMAVPLPDLKQQDRVALAREQARTWGHIVLLKGAYTVVAAPDGRCTLLPFANSALAVGGSGDVLSGVIVALLVQGLAPFEAAVLGGWLHAAAAELYPHPVGLRPDEIADYVPAAWTKLADLGA